MALVPLADIFNHKCAHVRLSGDYAIEGASDSSDSDSGGAGGGAGAVSGGCSVRCGRPACHRLH